MLVQANKGPNESAYVIVVGNEKGGSGKSTTAVHVAIALMKAGQRVATVDLDSRQKSLTHYIENRRAWAARSGLTLEIPEHHCVTRVDGVRTDENEAVEFNVFVDVVGRLEHSHDFIIIDTPGSDSYLMRLAHAMADTLITPLNDSFVDFDVLGTLDPTTYALIGTSHYAEMVIEARRQRRLVDRAALDWIVVRNRLSMLGSRSKKLLAEGLNELGLQLGFRYAEGFAERVVYREFFPRGLTALDDMDEFTLGTRPNLSHATAKQEVQDLLTNLRLPIDEKGRRRALARSEWFASADRPIETHDLLD
jgi:chromosome partitioning protein